MTDLPILYSFRRCPYAMRARMAILLSGQKVFLRELLLRNKPAEMLAASPKGTVPVLVLSDGQVIDESLDVMIWAFKSGGAQKQFWQNDQERCAMQTLIAQNDGPFKHHLDRYKYESRYQDESVIAIEHRAAGAAILCKLNERLSQGQLLGTVPRMVDYAIFPFVRQFRIPDTEWFDDQDWPALHSWLRFHLESDLFRAAMVKYPLFAQTGIQSLFGESLSFGAHA